MDLDYIKNEDCLKGMKELKDNSIDLVLTDIPYDGVNRESNGLRNLDKGKADVITFNLREMLSELYRVCKGSFYLFCGLGQISDMTQTSFTKTMIQVFQRLKLYKRAKLTITITETEE